MTIKVENLLQKSWSKKTSPWKLKIIMGWHQIVGNLHEKVRVEKVYEDTLVLGVYETCWMQELHLLSSMLIAKVNNYIGENHIKTIRLKYVQKHVFKKIKTPKASKNVVMELSEKETKILKKIKNPDLQSALKDFLLRCNIENEKE